MNTPLALTPAVAAFITHMPKVELHLHLEGSIQPITLLQIARRNDVDIPARDELGVVQLFKYRDFHEFLRVFMALTGALKYGRDFEQIGYELGLHLADQQVRYAEIMISPAMHYQRGLDLDEVVQGTAAGLGRARRERGIHFGLVFDYGRQFGVELAWHILEIAIRNMPYGLVGWSIGGDEIRQPPEPFAAVYAAARKAGLHTMAHAGEVVGPASVWGAVDALEVERLGHGIRSIDDAALVAHLRQRGVTLDICPTSNLRTGAVATLVDHPLRRLFDAGLCVTLNSDDPVFFNTTISDEYRLVVDRLGFEVDELVAMTTNAARAAFLPADERVTLLRQIEQDIVVLRSKLGV